MAGHDYLIIVAVAVIVVIQLYIWIRSKNLIKEYITVFKGIQFVASKAYVSLSDISDNVVKD